jgi:hypothetical protein
VAGSCEYGDESSGFGATELVIYIYIYIYIYVCVCVCVCERARARAREDTVSPSLKALSRLFLGD